MRPTIDLKNSRFGKLTVLEPAPTKGWWKTKCDCGNTKIVRGSSLTTGNTRSCGCLVHTNPGRPKQSGYKPHVPFSTIVYDTHDNMKAIRDAFARQGVVITGNGELRYEGRVERYKSAYHALAAAINKCVVMP